MEVPGPAFRIMQVVQKLGWKWDEFYTMQDHRGRPVAWLAGETGWFWHQVRAAQKQWLLAAVSTKRHDLGG
eukprot:12427679-Alexandrium_andersonii.AAC.1